MARRPLSPRRSRPSSRRRTIASDGRRSRDVANRDDRFGYPLSARGTTALAALRSPRSRPASATARYRIRPEALARPVAPASGPALLCKIGEWTTGSLLRIRLRPFRGDERFGSAHNRTRCRHRCRAVPRGGSEVPSCQQRPRHPSAALGIAEAHVLARCGIRAGRVVFLPRARVAQGASRGGSSPSEPTAGKTKLGG
jgi:hypothetical protein